MARTCPAFTFFVLFFYAYCFSTRKFTLNTNRFFFPVLLRRRSLFLFCPLFPIPPSALAQRDPCRKITGSPFFFPVKTPPTFHLSVLLSPFQGFFVFFKKHDIQLPLSGAGFVEAHYDFTITPLSPFQCAVILLSALFGSLGAEEKLVCPPPGPPCFPPLPMSVWVVFVISPEVLSPDLSRKLFLSPYGVRSRIMPIAFGGFAPRIPSNGRGQFFPPPYISVFELIFLCHLVGPPGGHAFLPTGDKSLL